MGQATAPPLRKHDRGRKRPGKTAVQRRPPCFAIIRRRLSPPVSHRGDIAVLSFSKRGVAAAMTCPNAVEPRPKVQ